MPPVHRHDHSRRRTQQVHAPESAPPVTPSFGSPLRPYAQSPSPRSVRTVLQSVINVEIPADEGVELHAESGSLRADIKVRGVWKSFTAGNVLATFGHLLSAAQYDYHVPATTAMAPVYGVDGVRVLLAAVVP
jgi:hypothetical protein